MLFRKDVIDILIPIVINRITNDNIIEPFYIFNNVFCYMIILPLTFITMEKRSLKEKCFV